MYSKLQYDINGSKIVVINKGSNWWIKESRESEKEYPILPGKKWRMDASVWYEKYGTFLLLRDSNYKVHKFEINELIKSMKWWK